MKQSVPYLMFSGNCREALTFYKACFNGEIVMMETFGESPIDVPDEQKDRIFNSEFRANDLHFKASDDLPSHPVTKGTNFALFVAFSDSAEQSRVFNHLAETGQIQFPLENGFGMLTDRFGLQWMLAG